MQNALDPDADVVEYPALDADAERSVESWAEKLSQLYFWQWCTAARVDGQNMGR